MEKSKRFDCFSWIYDDPRWPQIKNHLESIDLDLKLLKKTLRHFENLTTGRSTSSFKMLDEFTQRGFQVVPIFKRIFCLVASSSATKISPCTRSPTTNLWLTHSDTTLILCLMATCLTLPQSYLETFQSFNFSTIFDEVEVKAAAILVYLGSVLDERGQVIRKQFPERMCIRRHKVEYLQMKALEENRTPLLPILIDENTKSIEDFYGSIKVDFANEYIGGGALEYGLVQEEIMFVCHPELYVTMVLCSKMNENEAIGLTGFRKVFKTRGYSSSTELDGFEHPKYQYDQKNTCLKEYIVAIDASYSEQETERVILRDITKAYAGFSCFNQEIADVVSGNWGCGAFGGDIHHKLIIQMIAATLAQKKLIYCPFGKKLKLQKTYNIVKQMTISEAVKLLLTYSQVIREHKHLTFEQYVWRHQKKTYK